jgi:hypothetical protein
MKSLYTALRGKIFIAVFIFAAFNSNAQSTQGRVVINEFMPWPSGSCGTTAEFVELLNFGPGPINIGCYILTDGDYSITIPANTILKPGEYYILAGQNILGQPCGNLDSSITVDLNWNTCGCTSAAIPTTGDGFMTDGGSASEQLVLMDGAGNVVDAIVRSSPEASANITSSNVGSCTPLTFDLDLMTINYETIGVNAGRGNTFSRVTDGDCGWNRDSKQSADASNVSSGDVSDISYEIDIVSATQCGSVYGSVEIYVKHYDYAMVFPMTYTISFDSDNDGDFDFADTYTYGTDNSAPSVSINGLFLGRYRITVASVAGCYLQSFEFTILDCTAVLPVTLEYFKSSQTGNQRSFEWKLTDGHEIQKMILEKSNDGRNFTSEAEINVRPVAGSQVYHHTIGNAQAKYYRLKIKTLSGRVIYSNVVGIGVPGAITQAPKAWPMPAKDKVNISLQSDREKTATYQVLSSNGTVAAKGTWKLASGDNNMEVPLRGLPAGLYQLVVYQDLQPVTVKFIKQ